MEKRIELEKRRRSADQLYELILDNCRSTSIEGLTEEFVNLRFLSLIGVGLTSLKGFPKLAKLKKLELSDNRISGGLHILKEAVPQLRILNLSNNKIKDLENLEPLKELQELKTLDLYRNEVSQLEDYREKVFELLPGVSFIDSVDREGKDVEESDLEEDEPKEVNGKSEEILSNMLNHVGGEDDEDEDGEGEEDDEEGDTDGSEASEEEESEEELSDSSEEGHEQTSMQFVEPTVPEDDPTLSVLRREFSDDSSGLAGSDTEDSLQVHKYPIDDGDNLGSLIGPINPERRGKKRKQEDYYYDSD